MVWKISNNIQNIQKKYSDKQLVVDLINYQNTDLLACL